MFQQSKVRQNVQQIDLAQAYIRSSSEHSNSGRFIQLHEEYITATFTERHETESRAIRALSLGILLVPTSN